MPAVTRPAPGLASSTGRALVTLWHSLFLAPNPLAPLALAVNGGLLAAGACLLLLGSRRRSAPEVLVAEPRQVV